MNKKYSIKIYLIITLVLFFTSCSQKVKDSGEYKLLESKVKLLIHGNDSLEKINNNLSKEIDSLKNEVFQLNKAKFELNPSDWIYRIENPGGGFEYYILYSNGKVVITESLKDSYYTQLGYWDLTKDSLIFKINKIVYKRGVGDMIDFQGDIPNFPDWALYNEHIKTIELVSIQDSWGWVYWKKSVRHGELEILDEKPSDYPYSYYDEELKGEHRIFSMKKFTTNNLDYLKNKKSTLRIMKNEIFARYGYIFKSEDLKSYFSAKGWYEPRYENVDKYLSKIELHNIEVINDLINIK